MLIPPRGRGRGEGGRDRRHQRVLECNQITCDAVILRVSMSAGEIEEKLEQLSYVILHHS